MKDIIAIINQKGGVGKSSTANALGAGLSQRNFKVLYIDMDAQGNLSYSLDVSNSPISTLEVLTGAASVSDAIKSTPQGDIIPANGGLSGADTLITETGKEYRLKEVLEPLKKKYDYIIIDTPPALGILTVNALTACKSVIIPAQADIYSLQGIGQLSQTISAVKKYCNQNLKIKGILTTRYKSRTHLAKDMTTLLQQTADSLNTKLYNTKIRECIALSESQTEKEDIFSYSKKSNASEDYNNFVEEYLQG